MKLIYISIFTFLAFSNHRAEAQQGRLDVETVSPESYSIEFEGETGVTKQQAGARAMQAACDIARRHRYSHFAVTYFGMTEHLTRVRTRRGTTTGRVGQDGRPIDIQTTPDLYSNISSGLANLNIVLVNRGGVDMLAPLHDIVQASSCTVASNAPR